MQYKYTRRNLGHTREFAICKDWCDIILCRKATITQTPC